MTAFVQSADGTLTFMKDFSPVVVPSTHHNYEKIVTAIVNESAPDRAYELFKQTKEKITQDILGGWSKGQFALREDGFLYFRGEKCESSALAKQVAEAVNRNVEPKALLTFAERLFDNENIHVRTELPHFREGTGGTDDPPLAITEDGMLLAHKNVRRTNNPQHDHWTNTIHYLVDEVASIPRRDISVDPNVACGPGLHAGRVRFIRSYHGTAEQSIHMYVLIAPEDVMRVPHGAVKLAACKLKPVKIADGPESFNQDHVSSKAVVVTSDLETAIARVEHAVNSFYMESYTQTAIAAVTRSATKLAMLKDTPLVATESDVEDVSDTILTLEMLTPDNAWAQRAVAARVFHSKGVKNFHPYNAGLASGYLSQMRQGAATGVAREYADALVGEFADDVRAAEFQRGYKDATRLLEAVRVKQRIS